MLTDVESILLDALSFPEVGPANQSRRTDHSVLSHMVTAAKSETRLWVLDSVCYPIAQHPLLVPSSIISPSHSLNIMTDAELADMLAEALDDFGDAPGGDGHVRDTRVKEAYVSPSYSSSSSTTSSSPQHRGGRLQQRSSQPASSKWSTDDTSDVVNTCSVSSLARCLWQITPHHRTTVSSQGRQPPTIELTLLVIWSRARQRVSHARRDSAYLSTMQSAWRPSAWLHLHLAQTIS